jgi:anaphase-promoting complex subunit 8
MLFIIISTQQHYGSSLWYPEVINFLHLCVESPYDVRLWQAQGASYQEMGRLREAVKCLERALLGADANEIAIALKLAGIHHDLDETSDAVTYHRRVIDISRAMRMSSFHIPTSPSDDDKLADKPVAEWARSAMYVAQYHYMSDGGDLELARDLLEKVAVSNSEDADSAADLVKKVKGAIGRKEGEGVKEESSSVEM